MEGARATTFGDSAHVIIPACEDTHACMPLDLFCIHGEPLIARPKRLNVSPPAITSLTDIQSVWDGRTDDQSVKSLNVR